MRDIPTMTGRVISMVRAIGPRDARRLRELYNFERQRTLSDPNIDRLVSEMLKNTFIIGLQIYFAVFPDGSAAILNGNHTLEAIIKSGVTIDLTLTFFPCDTDAAGRVYAVFDSQKVRTWRDALRATGTAPEVRKPDQALPALSIIKHGFRSPQGASSKLETIDLLNEYGDAVDRFWDAIDGAATKNRDLVRRAGVMSIALVTFKAQPSLAHEFWHTMAHDNGLRDGMPEKALLNWLRGTKNTAGHIARQEHIVAATLGWNARFENGGRFYMKPNSVTEHLLVKGTAHRVPPVRSRERV